MTLTSGGGVVSLTDTVGGACNPGDSGGVLEVTVSVFFKKGGRGVGGGGGGGGRCLVSGGCGS